MSARPQAVPPPALDQCLNDYFASQMKWQPDQQKKNKTIMPYVVDYAVWRDWYFSTTAWNRSLVIFTLFNTDPPPPNPFQRDSPRPLLGPPKPVTCGDVFVAVFLGSVFFFCTKLVRFVAVQTGDFSDTLSGMWLFLWPAATFVAGSFSILAGSCAVVLAPIAIAFLWSLVSLAVEVLLYAAKKRSHPLVRAAFFTFLVCIIDLYFLPFFPSLSFSSFGRAVLYVLPSLLVGADSWWVSTLRRAAEGGPAGGGKVKVKKGKVPRCTVKKPLPKEEQVEKVNEVE